MRVFVIRPFGTKSGVDFDAVDRDLIQEALAHLRGQGINVAGGGTGEISRQGNIRTDMFRLIALADLVIADVSIHNANVFYELGMRHALRPRHTFLIRYRAAPDTFPFDLQTDRYFLYDKDAPALSVAELAAALRSSLAAKAQDSPMFALLPGLRPHGRQDLAAVPPDFQDEVAVAGASNCHGKLRLLTEEAEAFEWDHEGLRRIGDTQFRLRAYADARDTFERLLRSDPEQVHANLRLATIYQKLSLLDPANKNGLLTLSEQAIRRVLAHSDDVATRAESWSLSASNAKSAWNEELDGVPAEQRIAVTLGSAHFDASLKRYLKAANHDLNAHYPASNALALLRVRIAGAKARPDIWNDLHDNDAQAASALAASERLANHLTSTLLLALELDELMGHRDVPADSWRESSRADFLLLSNSERTGQIKKAYRVALTGADYFTLQAVRRNLDIFKRLNLFEPGLAAALEVVDELITSHPPATPVPAKVLLFTGHMIDAPGKPARFPATTVARDRARALIREAVAREIESCSGEVLAVAGGACGGDTLFHEVCIELGVRSELYLALPPEKFESKSVVQGGREWVDRFRAIERRLTTHVLQPDVPLPDWLAEKRGYDVWQRANLWMMFSALAVGARDRVLIALYNPTVEQEGPGGTGHLVEVASRSGYKPVQLDARILLEP